MPVKIMQLNLGHLMLTTMTTHMAHFSWLQHYPCCWQAQEYHCISIATRISRTIINKLKMSCYILTGMYVETTFRSGTFFVAFLVTLHFIPLFFHIFWYFFCTFMITISGTLHFLELAMGHFASHLWLHCISCYSGLRNFVYMFWSGYILLYFVFGFLVTMLKHSHFPGTLLVHFWYIFVFSHKPWSVVFPEYIIL